MAPITRAQRYRQIVTVLVEEGFGTVLDQLGMRAPWVASLRGPKEEPAERTPEQRVRRALERLGPAYSKMGQLLSVRPDLILPSYATELAKLQDEMEPFGFEAAKREIEESFGRPLSDLFARFEEKPGAAATIGQVHFAVLHDGTPVAVKVQRPGIRDVIEADLEILQTQARRIQGRTDFGSRYDVVGLVGEFARVLHEECDYLHEGANADRLGADFADDASVHFPSVHWELTSPTVLTLDRIHGVSFNRPSEIDSAGLDRTEAARRGITCYYEQIFVHGFYHADPHPGNLFAMADGRVAFTDFGRAGVLSDQARRQVADLLVAIIDKDGELAADILIEVSRARAAVDYGGLKRDVTALLDKYYDMRLHEVDVVQLLREVMTLIGRRGLTLSSEFALLLTTLATIGAMGSALDPDFHFVQSVQPFARRIVEEEIRPEAIAKGFMASLRRTIKGLEGFPHNFNRAVKRVGDGDLRMTVYPGGFDALMTRLEQMVDRLAFALVVSAFVLGFSWLLAPTVLPGWLRFIAGLTLVASAGVGFGFFMSAILRHFRQRRIERRRDDF